MGERPIEARSHDTPRMLAARLSSYLILVVATVLVDVALFLVARTAWSHVGLLQGLAAWLLALWGIATATAVIGFVGCRRVGSYLGKLKAIEYRTCLVECQEILDGLERS